MSFALNPPQLIRTLGASISWESSAAVSTTVEAAFYWTLKGGVQNTSRLVNWIRETSIARIQAIQVIFNVANAGIVLLCIKELTDKVLEKISATDSDSAGKNFQALKSISIFAAIATTVALSVLKINRYSAPLAPQRREEGVTIAETLSPQQKIAKILHRSKLILNVALACFAKNRFWFAVSLVGSGYALCKNLQLKWIAFSRTANYQPYYHAPSFNVTYSMLVLPPASLSVEVHCEICQKGQVDMAFCANHVFHQACMSQVVVKKSPSLMNRARDVKGMLYTYEIPQENLPCCPSCGDVPIQNGLKFYGTESEVNIARPSNRQYLFENLYAIYNTAQTGLSSLQTYPELAAAIFNIQKVMMVTDLIGYGITAYYLHNKICEKFHLQDSKTFKKAAAAILVAAVVVSYFAALKINTYLSSALVLKELLSQLPIAPEILKGIEVTWNGPLIRQLMQCLYINRIVATVALSFFSTQRKTNLLSAAAQLASLIGISNLKWIEFSQTFEHPIQKIVEEGGKLSNYVHQNSVKSVKLITQCFVESSVPLKSTLESIYNYSNSFFSKSAWHRYWWVTYQNGSEVGRKIYYSITLQHDPVKHLPHLTNYYITVVDATFGNAGVDTLIPTGS